MCWAEHDIHYRNFLGRTLSHQPCICVKALSLMGTIFVEAIIPLSEKLSIVMVRCSRHNMELRSHRTSDCVIGQHRPPTVRARQYPISYRWPQFLFSLSCSLPQGGTRLNNPLTGLDNRMYVAYHRYRDQGGTRSVHYELMWGIAVSI